MLDFVSKREGKQVEPDYVGEKKLCLKIDLVSHPAHVKGFGKYIL